MSRKDYIALAADLKIERAQLKNGTAIVGFDNAVTCIIAALKRNNPSFDTDRFIAAVKG